MRIHLTSVPVDDQEKALKFYTEVLGFVKKTEVPLGDVKWLTVVSPQQTEGTELLLEPDASPAVGAALKTYKSVLVAAGIPYTAFAVDDIEEEHRRLVKLGVRFTMPPTRMEPVTVAVLDDTCGNLIQLVEH